MFIRKGLSFVQLGCTNSSLVTIKRLNETNKCKSLFRCLSSSSSGSGPSDTVEPKISPRFSKKIMSGQPTYQTHPQVLQPDEITVGITFDEYKSRRNNVMDLLCQQEGRHHVLVLPAMPRRYMIEKIPFVFRQDTDFLYCSGCLEPDSVLIIHTVASKVISRSPSYKSIMFCPSVSSSQLVWDGPKTSFNDASQVWGVDEGLPLSDLSNYLSLLEQSLHSPTLWYHYKDTLNSETRKTLLSWMSEGRVAGLESPKTHLHRARLTKSKAEQNLMRQACRISAEAIKSTISWSEANMSEHQLYAKVDYENRIRGASQLAYPPVIAGGERGNIIHYINNNQVIEDGEMVLMDAGGEYHGYSGDVSRTWPINGSFTPHQRELYEAVLHVQSAILKILDNNRPSLDQLYRMMCNELAAVLTEIGITPSNYSKEQKLKVAMALCPHHISHYLGMDVHDTASVPRHEPIVPGSIITVEPGMYIPRGCHLAPSRYHGLGIRIEDDILITDTGCENLSKDCPRHPDEIENLMRRSN